ncbi:copper homeostasis protein cutC homolog [Anthonomus grandis grandis]|uniref:copper homeostasis protein cutC homolog n=1 Tax=Anthonomus grandis grandis TaxID=2921223 RepID=UPI0021657D29|nr:copper homeostasis protein cutC homolog [Anthonomus grandis grandis]
MSKVLEVCVDSLESAVAALNGGADRLELCSSLIEGGLTPTPGILIQIQNMNPRKVPVYCMLRCRPGNFIYKPEEIEAMKEDARILRKSGANGFVFGALADNGDVDMKTCREIVKACYPLPITFHRAFDFVRRPTIEVEVIIDLGFERILTSGKQKSAQMGVKLIKKLIDQVGNRIIIMPGCGVDKDNIKFILENTNAKEIHGSFKKLKDEPKPEVKDDEADISLSDENIPIYVTDEENVAEIINILKNL